MGVWKSKMENHLSATRLLSAGPVSDNRIETPDTPEMSRMATFVPEAPIRTLDELVAPMPVKMQIDTALNRIRYHNVLYEDWNLKKIDPYGNRVAINFYGPPGTGKTFCAEAIAHHLNRTIIRVNYAEIESKYVGETPKNIKAAFKKAQEAKSVLFFDEADSILGKRLTQVTQSADHGVNVSRSVMLMELDRFDGIVIFASNLPANYDGAFVRRIMAHIEFILPDVDCLSRLWAYLLPDETPRAADVDTQWLARESEGLSGGDILNVIKLAASMAVTRNGDDRQIEQRDILQAISQVRNAQQKIGSKTSDMDYTGARPVQIRQEVIAAEQLPPDIQQAYASRVENLGS
ncbi:ATP-binding protein [Desulfatirhabdium butyrativorans]|uniref:ATP-binding protein n=1 Tax=Desulfatirhabdium butyrativorans TaxID=340467 RepID=UPI000A052729|nr:ATP-binding protein [Desulfatirhabdium butyrativorans]